MRITKSKIKAGALAAALMVPLVVTPPAHAGGFLGDAINVIAPGVGTKLDQIHRDAGRPLDTLGKVAMAPVTLPATIIGQIVVKPLTQSAMAPVVDTSHAISQDVNGAIRNLREGVRESFGLAHATVMQMFVEGAIVLFSLAVGLVSLALLFKIFSVALSLLVRDRRSHA